MKQRTEILRFISFAIIIMYGTSLYGARCVSTPPFIEIFNAGPRDFLGVTINIQVTNLGTESQTIKAELPNAGLQIGWVRTDGKYYNDPPSPTATPTIIPAISPGSNATFTVPAQSNGGTAFSVHCRITWGPAVSCSPNWHSALAMTSIGKANLTNSAIYGGATVKVCIQEDRGAVLGSVYARYSSDNVAVGTDKSFSLQLNGGRPF